MENHFWKGSDNHSLRLRNLSRGCGCSILYYQDSERTVHLEPALYPVQQPVSTLGVRLILGFPHSALYIDLVSTLSVRLSLGLSH